MSNNPNSLMDIKNTFKSMNQAWLSGNTERLNDYFHNDIVIVSPDMKVLGKGKEECIKSYIDFLSHAKVLEIKENEPEVFLYDKVAIVFYEYEIFWEIKGKKQNEKGKEIYVFNFTGEKWLVVMRKIVPKKM